MHHRSKLLHYVLNNEYSSIALRERRMRPPRYNPEQSVTVKAIEGFGTCLVTESKNGNEAPKDCRTVSVTHARLGGWDIYQ